LTSIPPFHTGGQFLYRVTVRGPEADKGVADWERPNLDRLTVGVDVGDQWSNYCFLGLGGETPAEGQFPTQPEEVGGFFHDLASATGALRQNICETELVPAIRRTPESCSPTDFAIKH
jgi:hypothetical protein